MAIPVNDNYTALSGAILKGGRGIPSGPSGSLPAWRQAMAPFTWAVVPFTNTLASQNPELDASINPDYPGAAGIWHGSSGHSSILDAWCGMAPSMDDGRVFLPVGGGHGDWFGNEAYSADLMAEAPSWQRISDPSGSIGMTAISAYDGQEATGVYADGRIRAMHSYSTAICIPGKQGIFQSVVAAPSYNPSVTAVNKSFWIDKDTGAHSVASDFTSLAEVSGVGDGTGVCYDPVRNVVWQVRNAGGLGSRMIKTDMATGVSTSHGTRDTRVSGYSRFVYIPGHDLVANLTGSPGTLMLWNPATETWINRGTPGGVKSAGWSALRLCGADWCPQLGAIVIWGQGTGYTTEVTLLTPPIGDAWTGAWTYSVLPADVANVVTPNIWGGGGVFTKFAYHPVLKGFYLKPTYANPMYFLSTE